MPATYEKIATQTVSGSPTSFSFTSIPATYTDLRISLVAVGTGGTQYIKYNGSSTGYSNTWILGEGSAASSGSSTSYPRLDLNSQEISTSTPQFYSIDIMSYAGSTFKTCLITSQSDQNGSGMVQREVGLWQSTSAITSIEIFAGNNWSVGTTATLYGILKA